MNLSTAIITNSKTLDVADDISVVANVGYIKLSSLLTKICKSKNIAFGNAKMVQFTISTRAWFMSNMFELFFLADPFCLNPTQISMFNTIAINVVII